MEENTKETSELLCIKDLGEDFTKGIKYEIKKSDNYGVVLSSNDNLDKFVDYSRVPEYFTEDLKISMEKNVEQFREVCDNITEVYAMKNHDYGNSFDNTLNEFGLIAGVVRMNDKMNRIKTLVKKDAKIKDESIRDTLLDLATYCIMTSIWIDNNK